jgi:sialic acid synthase SpsE/quercetin dioxygenase-like cupin family protein
MKSRIPSPLITFEMANNHMGDVDHGRAIIRTFAVLQKEFPEFNFAFKLQYRNLDTFIHKSVRNSSDIKHIKRFNETRLAREQLDLLIATAREESFLVMATPFDEDSVDLVNQQRLDIVKIASCSFGDWPLIEQIATLDLPIIASTAGATTDTLDAVVSFLKHRDKDFALLHCVAEYPTLANKMQLNQIDYIRERYTNQRVGFSTHEDPSDTEIVKLAVAKGADIFEKHVGLETEKYSLNAYSATLEQTRKWLMSIANAMEICGSLLGRSVPGDAERESLHSLRRGVFVRSSLKKGSKIGPADVYFAFPPSPGQLTANDWGKYCSYETSTDLEVDQAILKADCNFSDHKNKLLKIASEVKALLKTASVVVPGDVELEISHHYGLDRFSEFGLVLITVVNRTYCKKLLVSLKDQSHPEQYHKDKEETFHILFGELHLTLDGITSIHKPGDVITINPGVKHQFVSPTGSIIEEISSTHYLADSFYTDDAINSNKHRKTTLTYWMS